MKSVGQYLRYGLCGVVAVCQVTVMGAQDLSFRKNHVSWGMEVEGARLLSSEEYDRDFIRSHGARYYGLNVRFQPLRAYGDAYDRAFRFPSLEFGLLLGDFHDIHFYRERGNPSLHSGAGYMVAAYGAFRRDILSAGPFRLNYLFENGIGWSSRPYDGHTNPDNELVGSPFSVYFSMGLGGRLLLGPRWEASLAFRFRHFSNGALDRPNKGINTVGVSAGVRYRLPSPGESSEMPAAFDTPVRKRFYLDLSVGWIARTFIEDWIHSVNTSPDDPAYRTRDFRLYSGIGTSLAAMYRYGIRFASGVGVDYSYLPYVDDMERTDRMRQREGLSYSRHCLGLSLRHEVFYKHFSLYFSLGYYLHRAVGGLSHEFEKPYYETLGLRYTLPFCERLYIGYHVKAHLFRADHIEFNVGCRIP